MKDALCRLCTPWNAGGQFEDEDVFLAFLQKRCRALGGLRIILFALAAILLIVGYAMPSVQPYYYIAAAVLVLALAVTLWIARTEKELPKEMRTS